MKKTQESNPAHEEFDLEIKNKEELEEVKKEAGVKSREETINPDRTSKNYMSNNRILANQKYFFSPGEIKHIYAKYEDKNNNENKIMIGELFSQAVSNIVSSLELKEGDFSFEIIGESEVKIVFDIEQKSHIAKGNGIMEENPTIDNKKREIIIKDTDPSSRNASIDIKYGDDFFRLEKESMYEFSRLVTIFDYETDHYIPGRG